MDVEDITKVKAGRGTVLVTPLKENNYIIVDGQKVYVDTSFNKEKHAISCGRAVSVCEVIDDSLLTTIEVLPGDTVFFHYLSILNAIRDNKVLECDGIKYYAVPYESLYVAKRTIQNNRYSAKEILDIYEQTGNLIYQATDELVICLNGFILVAPKKEYNEGMIDGILLPECMMSQEQVSRGVVKYFGSQLRGDKVEIKQGDDIIFRKSSSVPLQYDLHASFQGENKFYRMRRESILAISRNETSSEITPESFSEVQR